MDKKLTADEILRLEEEEKKKQAEAEMKRLKQEQLAEKRAQKIQRLHELKLERERNKFIKEDKMAKENMDKIDAYYSKVLYDEKCEEKKKEMKIIRYNSDKAVEQTDKRIAELVEQFEEEEDRTMINVQTVSEIVDDALADFFRRAREMNEKYRHNVKSTLSTWKRDRRLLSERLNEEIESVKLQHYLTNKDLLTVKKNHGVATLHKKDDVINRNAVEIQTLLKDRETNHGKVWKTICDFLSENEKSTRERRQQYEAEKLNNEQSTKLVNFQSERIVRLINELKNLKTELSNLNQDYDVADLRKLTSDYREKYSNVRNTVQMEQRLDTKRITALTTLSNASIKYLEDKVNKANKVLGLSSICRKFETEEEKIIPFKSDSFEEKTERIGTLTSGSVSSLHSNISLLSGESGDLDDVKLFWTRASYADMKRAELAAEKAMLLEEKAQLTRKLCEVLNCRCDFLEKEISLDDSCIAAKGF